MSKINSICVYCGSQPGIAPEFMEGARELGLSMARNEIRLVYGGGSRGIMGGVSQGVMDGGGHVLGIIPNFLLGFEGEWDTTSEKQQVIVTANMHERKQHMFEESDAFIALPGGIGTLEEIIEIMTWAQLGQHAKPIAFLNINGFWNPMLELISHMRSSGFIHTENKVQPLVIDRPEDVVEAIQSVST